MADIPWDELMDAAGDSDFAPIPASDYNVKITSTEATKSTTDKPMWKYTVEVLDGPHAGRKVWGQQTLTQDNPNALDIFFRQMAAAGLTKEFFRTKPSAQEIADAMLGRVFRARVAIKEYQGSPRNEIKGWNPASASAGGPPPMGAARSGGPPPPPAAAPPPPPPPVAAPPAAPAAAAPPSAPPAAPAAPPPAAAPAAVPPPAAPEAAPAAAAAAAPAGGDAASWVVEPRNTGSHEPPPF